MRQDPNWQRFRAKHQNVVVSTPGAEPVVGIGGFRCTDCNQAHLSLALVATTGDEINVLVTPEVAVELFKKGVQILGDLGESLVALNALRALTIVSELATMTDTEADFLDGHELRESCRQLQAGKPATFQRLYDENDRTRAISALIRQFHKLPAEGQRNLDGGEAIDAIAEALGMRRAGG
jgi:hypothetical protein